MLIYILPVPIKKTTLTTTKEILNIRITSSFAERDRFFRKDFFVVAYAEAKRDIIWYSGRVFGRQLCPYYFTILLRPSRVKGEENKFIK